MAWPKGKPRKQLRTTESAVPASEPRKVALLLDADVADFLSVTAALDNRQPSDVIRALINKIRKPSVKIG